VDPSGNFAIIDDIIAAIVYLATSKLFISVSGGAALGAMQSAATGGNVWQGALTGAIGGALFFGAGEVVGELGLAGATTIAGRAAVAGIHAAAGMVSGGINSAITGGNIGLGMLTGGISGGLGSFAGGFLPKDFGSQLIGRSLIGGIAGGITAEIAGGEFGQGFALGAGTAAAGFLFNELNHPALEKYQRDQLQQQERFNKWIQGQGWKETEIGGQKVLVDKSGNPINQLSVKFEGGSWKIFSSGATIASAAAPCFAMPTFFGQAAGFMFLGSGLYIMYLGSPSIEIKSRY